MASSLCTDHSLHGSWSGDGCVNSGRGLLTNDFRQLQGERERGRGREKGKGVREREKRGREREKLVEFSLSTYEKK